MGVIPFPNLGYEPALPKHMAAREIGCSPRTLERYVAAGAPHERTSDGHLRVVPSRVIEWKAEREEPADGVA